MAEFVKIERKFLIKDLPIIDKPYKTIVDVTQYHYIDNGFDYILSAEQYSDKIIYSIIDVSTQRFFHGMRVIKTDEITNEDYSKKLKIILNNDATTFLHKIKYITDNVEIDIYDFKLAILIVPVESMLDDIDVILSNLKADILFEITGKISLEDKYLSKKIN
jgi:hypothetical protein